MTTALAGTLGTGNIVGVATAIVAGGPGAVFWMWISAFFGMMTKYAEVLLAIKFRKQSKDGRYLGGPMYYIEHGLHKKWLAVLFAVFCAIASFGIGNMAQTNSIAQAMENAFGVNELVSGVVTAIIIAVIIIGGVKRIAQITEKIVPFMAIVFIIGAIVALMIKFENIPSAFCMIFDQAFCLRSVGGGVSGYVMMNAFRFGFARGIFSNEAGLGSAPIAHAAAETDSPVKQGMWGIFEVFADTIVMCTLTTLVIITSGLWDSGLNGIALTSAAFGASFGGLSTYFISISTVFFAIATIIGWSYYGERCIEYIFKSKGFILLYRIVFVLLIIVGATTSLTLVWDVSDTLNGLMAIPNLIGIIGLSSIVFSTTKEHYKNKKTAAKNHK
jgi:AGCS family alanine or glycine:cation symporter